VTVIKLPLKLFGSGLWGKTRHSER